MGVGTDGEGERGEQAGGGRRGEEVSWGLSGAGGSVKRQVSAEGSAGAGDNGKKGWMAGVGGRQWGGGLGAAAVRGGRAGKG